MFLSEDAPGNSEGEPEKPSEPPAHDTYVVQRGDTLAGVALKLGVKQSQLKRANHMYGSRTLMAGQVLKTSGPVLPSSGRNVPSPASTERLSGAQHTSGSMEDGTSGPVSESAAGATPAAVSAAPFAAMMTAGASAPAAKAEDYGMVVEPPEEEVWFEEERQSQTKGTFDTAVTAAEGSLVPAEETMRSVPSATPELLYKPPSWGGGGGMGLFLSDDSTSSASAAATGGAPARGMLEYLRSKAAAVLTPSASDAATGGSGGRFFAADAAADGASPGGHSRQPSGAGTADSSVYFGSTGGSLQAAPGFLSVGEGLAPSGLPPAEVWAGARQDSVQSVPWDVSEVAQSTVHALLSLVNPHYWRMNSEEVGGHATGDSALDCGDGQSPWREAGCVGSNQWASLPGGDSVDNSSPTAVNEPMFSSLDNEASLLPHGEQLGMGEPGAPSTPSPAPLKLPGLVCGGSTIVTHPTLARMEAAHPKHYRGYNWHLLFSTFRDGASYTTLYNRIKEEAPTVLMVESMEGEVFGGFATSAWESASKYYGTGECFLFKIDGERVIVDGEENDADNDSAEREENDAENDSPDYSGEGSRNGTGNGTAGTKTLIEGDVTTFGWTGMNMYLQYSDCQGMAMGGGGDSGNFGLFIGEDFQTGSTGECDTYGNPPLCSKAHFQVSQVEVWGFTTAETEMGARLERLRKTLRGRTTRPL